MSYVAKDALDVELLSSIPKKVFAWLKYIQYEDSQYSGMFWNFSENFGCVAILNIDERELYTIKWEGPLTKPTSISGSQFWMEAPSKYLELFIELERQIYDTLEYLQTQVELEKDLEDRDFQASETPAV